MSKKSVNMDDELNLDAILAEFSGTEENPGETAVQASDVEVCEEETKVNPPMEKEPEEEKPIPHKDEKAVQRKEAAATKKQKSARKGMGRRWLAALGKTAVTVLGIGLSVLIIVGLGLTAGANAGSAQGRTNDVTIMDKFDMFMTNEISTALEGVLAIEKVYWLSDTDQVAPKPNEDNYGYTENPKDMEAVLRNARPLTGNTELLFSMDRPIWTEEGITYYYDETILVITWKEVVNDVVYTISEVMIAHPSQFRRFLAGGEFGSDKQYITTEMAQSVNAVVASSGDFYKFRRNGIIVYQNTVQRFENRSIDTCYIDENGDMSFTRINELKDETDAQNYVDENKIRFSLCFGPILIDDGVACPPGGYLIGEIRGTYSRMALCQKGELHYLMVNATAEKGHSRRPTIFEFTDVLETYGVDKAYALDGGQTTVITMGEAPINKVDYGYQRQISDIIYFATALPDGE